MYQLKRKAIALFRNPMAPKAVQRHNQRAWLTSMDKLGDRHLLAIPVRRLNVQ